MNVVVEFSKLDPCAVLEVVIWAALEPVNRCANALARRLRDEQISPVPTGMRELREGLRFPFEQVVFTNGDTAADSCKRGVDFSNDEAPIEGYGPCEAVGKIVLNHCFLCLVCEQDRVSGLMRCQ